MLAAQAGMGMMWRMKLQMPAAYKCPRWESKRFDYSLLIAACMLLARIVSKVPAANPTHSDVTLHRLATRLGMTMPQACLAKYQQAIRRASCK